MLHDPENPCKIERTSTGPVPFADEKRRFQEIELLLFVATELQVAFAAEIVTSNAWLVLES